MSDADSHGRLSAVKGWLITAFAAPSALAVLAKIDDRLDFLPFLERIIIGFDKVSSAFWVAIGDMINFDLTSTHGVLTFYLICIFMILRFSVASKSFRPGSFWNKLAESVSMAAIFVALTSTASWTLGNYVTMFIFFFGLFGYAISTEERDKIGLPEILFIVTLAVFLILLFAIFGSSSTETAIASAIGIISTYTIRYIGAGNLFFSRVSVFCLGVFAVNFTGETLAPLIDGYLVRIGI